MNQKCHKIFDSILKQQQKQYAFKFNIGRKANYVSKEIGLRMADRLDDIKIECYKKVLGIGINTVDMIENCDRNKLEEVSIFDDQSLEISKNSFISQNSFIRWLPSENFEQNFNDQETENEYDAIFSNLTLHWVNDLLRTFCNIEKALKPDGLFMATVLGGDTLYELR